MKTIIKFLKKIKSGFSKKKFKWLKYLPKTLTKFDRYSLTALALVLAVSIGAIWYHHYLLSTHPVATYGGAFSEGIVGQPKDVEKALARLTYAGLTKFDSQGNVTPDLAESWQILDNGATYQFKIRSGYSAGDLLDTIQNKNLWPGVDASSPDGQTLVFKFKQPFSPFLYDTTQSIFPYGPYKITNETSTKITLEPNSNYWPGKAYISKIEVNLYADYNSLIAAAHANEMMGYVKEQNSDFQITNATTYEMPLPRELDLFFNLSKPALQDINIRTSLRDNKPLAQNLNLTLATSDSAKNVQIANNLKSNWQKNNVTLTIQTYNNATLQKDIIPARNYDILLYGQDYGSDPDPYPFWHSSQISATGMNLSDFSNKTADKLLEDARQTFDAAARTAKYQSFQTILDQNVPYINIEKENCYYTLSNDVLGVNKIYGFSEADRFLNVSNWYIKTKRVKN